MVKGGGLRGCSCRGESYTNGKQRAVGGTVRRRWGARDSINGVWGGVCGEEACVRPPPLNRPLPPSLRGR